MRKFVSLIIEVRSWLRFKNSYVIKLQSFFSFSGFLFLFLGSLKTCFQFQICTKKVCFFLISDENDQSHQQMGPNSPNPKKLTQKHYMSPTISAASKAIIPKKENLSWKEWSLKVYFLGTRCPKGLKSWIKNHFFKPGNEKIW